MGMSVIDTSSGAGVLATVYVDRVGQLARDTATAPPVILARAIAHEVGHLLLGSEHGSQGSCARSVVRDVRRDADSAWVFTPAETSACGRRSKRDSTEGTGGAG